MMDYRNFVSVFTEYLKTREQVPIIYQKEFSRNSYAFSNSAFTLLYSEIKKQRELKLQYELAKIQKGLKRTNSLRNIEYDY